MTDGKAQTPGGVIKAELERRGWTQADLAIILGKHLPAVNEVIQGKRSITSEMAVSLAAALGQTPEYWAKLDAEYRVSDLEPNAEIARRASIYSLAPVSEMEKRQWIRRTDSLSKLEKELCSFFNVESLDQPPAIRANARQAFKTDTLNPAQIAWCCRAAKLASIIDAESFKPREFQAALTEIRKLADYPEKTKHLPKLLSKVGVRLVIVEPLSHSRIDGAAFWLADDAPVIVLSIRYDRIDAFWHTLAHEISHIRHNDAQSIDFDLVGESRAEQVVEVEARANRDASNLLIPTAELKSFVLRMKPFYSKARIVQFAIRMQVHPGIVVGQLQHGGEIGWSTNREMLAKVRDIATSTAVTDGWGKSAPVL